MAVLVAIVVAGCAPSSGLVLDTGDDVRGDDAVTITAESITTGSIDTGPITTGSITTGLVDASTDTNVRAAIDHLFTLRMACGRNPGRCNVDALAAPSSSYRSSLVDLMAFRVRHRLRTVAGYGTLRWRIEHVSHTDADRAEVHTCATDSLVVFDAAGGEPGYVFDDSIVSTRTAWTLVYVNGGWKWSEEHILAQRRGVGLCGGS